MTDKKQTHKSERKCKLGKSETTLKLGTEVGIELTARELTQDRRHELRNTTQYPSLHTCPRITFPLSLLLPSLSFLSLQTRLKRSIFI